VRRAKIMATAERWVFRMGFLLLHGEIGT